MSRPHTIQNLEDEQIGAVEAGGYATISVAGSGCAADVVYCIPKVIIHKAIAEELDVSILRKEVLAIKIDGSKLLSGGYSSKPFMQKEADLLRHIHDHVPNDLRSIFPSLIDTCSLDSKCMWYALEAIYPPLRLSTLHLTSDGTQTPSMMMHLFLEIGAAINFLHNDAKLVHNDIHGGNILVTIQPRNQYGLPGFKIVDFGQTKMLTNEFQRRRDNKAFFIELYLFAKFKQPDGGEDELIEGRQKWTEFNLHLQEARFSDNPPFDSFWKENQRYARKIRSLVSERSVNRVNSNIQNALRLTGASDLDIDIKDCVENERKVKAMAEVKEDSLCLKG
ncbi:hypothetical protein BS50DRAFT_634937 [Corynespora cassiicola Philippines]|uniref:Protein kinase domain-containing protein n=1 Tax=Corynespora cassiicola Philippines TaxID=1448308 RepID=A0A2T2NJU7_CORCC|nr:hypothetical protein BS50DRAFT_634937 [Corynespora cassiicola Philippines]